ncbi:MAG: hypothetical protein R6U98_26380, partial [Pirellulaceae bacterium]
LDLLEKKKTVTKADLEKAVEDAFGSNPAAVINKKTPDAAAKTLKDSIIVIKLLPEQHRKPLERLTNRLRDIELIYKLGGDKKLPDSGPSLRRYRHRSVMLPTEADLKSALNYEEAMKKIEEARKRSEERRRREAEAKFELYKNLKKAIKEPRNTVATISSPRLTILKIVSRLSVTALT